jgi:hypothetical protein
MGRFLGLTLRFDSFDGRRQCVKRKSLSLFLPSVYHPCHDTPHEKFINTLSSILHRIQKIHRLSLALTSMPGWADVIAMNSMQFLDPMPPPHHNTRGSNLLSLYLSHKLWVENTFHMHQPIALTPTSKMVIRPWSTFMHVQSHSTAAYASAVWLSMASKLIMQLSILIWHSPCSSGQTWLLSEVPLIGNTLQLTNPPNSTTMISSLMPPSPLTCHSRHSIMQ